ncbi:endoribonuclease Dicer [Pectinophora gossypiella]|nr:endoribonuclease Dicer [Pectinophora gossypiella]XP_049884014.1 endoribonuclease Dicer [Pectinophora gossypiella]XP_049884015.1 endoribonuclease Dicer [Pectinophora gossypiella]
MEAPCSRFTAAEGGARLAAAATAGNTLAVEYGSFISTRMIYEDAYKIRGSLSEGRQRSVYCARASRVPVVAHELQILTDLAVTTAVEYDPHKDWTAELDSKEVLVCTSSVLRHILEAGLLGISNINVLVLDSCHHIATDEGLQYIMQQYKACEDTKRPRILALTYPLFSSPKKENATSAKTDEDQTKEEKVDEEQHDEETDGDEKTDVIENVPKIVEITDDVSKSKDNDEELKEINREVKEDEKKRRQKKEEVEAIGVYENLDDFDMYEKLEWKIEQLEKDLCCQMDLAEDIDGGKRLSATITKPKEVIIEYSPQRSPDDQLADYSQLESYMRDTIGDAEAFLDEHRYDPTEIYGEDLYEEFKNIPDPTMEPKYIFRQFVYVLDELGPYAADKAAFSLLTKLEKLKIKVPYERHFLLLCLCTSVFVKIRCYTDIVFSKYSSDWEKIKTFSTPKVLRFAEILEKFSPPEQPKEFAKIPDLNKDNRTLEYRMKTDEMMQTIEKCDFMSLSDKIQDKVNSFEANLKELDESKSKSDELAPKELDSPVEVTTPQNELPTPANELNSPQDNKVLGFSRRSGHRARGRGRVQRSNAARVQQMQQNPDALCGIVFMKEALMAKIMFMVIVDMSRSSPKLSYICAQYCAVEKPADSGTEPRECQRQAKKQEDVLKKFRMHECNLLLATSALEEGIDLPRCNLVVRWDIPASYRSYGLCRSRGRAPRAACALLARGRSAQARAALHHVAVYRELDQIISRKCGCGMQNEPPQSEEDHADSLTHLIKPYTPNDNRPRKDSNILTQNNKQKIQDKTQSPNNIKLENDEEQKVTSENNSEIINCVDNSDSLKQASENNKNGENLLCNKCNIKRNSVDTVCQCVISERNEIVVNSFGNNKKSDKKTDDGIASVDLSNAIALINRYCGKLPSDTFTRLAPQWWMEEVQLPAKGSADPRRAFICTLRLPLNCPVKYNIVGHPMPTQVLARRMVALQACRILHKSGELDNQLMPIGKENFKAAELDSTCNMGDSGDPSDCARPGTTKRRQYYYKRTAWAFTDCQPVVDATDAEIDPSNVKEAPTQDATAAVKNTGTKRNMLYAIVSKLWCALPERYNTRGRRLHAPQNASQALGILMAREEPDNLQIPAFPVYTRSGEVRVSVEYVPDADVRVSPRRGRLVRRFMRFVFAEVLRVRRRGMKLQSEGSTHNNYYIVPTIKSTREDGTSKMDIDWSFLELIYQHTEEKKHSEIERPNLWHHDEEEEESVKKVEKKNGEVKKMSNPLLKEGETFVFDPEKYREAVVTPWYRNQDQPQFFLVAEICWNLTPDSEFPSASHTTFRQYYSSKYGVTLTQSNQPLLDVDHTSNRLNLLTPRYVNRKGVALPVSSERTRRAKRDRLDQKQILVPELCRVHPFAAPLWFATVALPCVLYRINALLIADEIRRAVAIEVGLGIPKIDEETCPGFQWPPLDFGWSLAEVLNADSEKSEKKKDEEDTKEKAMKEIEDKDSKNDEEGTTEEGTREKTINDILHEKEAAESGFEIGTWSNDMASSIPSNEYDEFMEPLPPNLTFVTSASGGTNWCDPVEKPKCQFQPSSKYSMADSDCSYMSSDFDTDDSDLNSEVSDDDTDTSGFFSSKNSNAAMGVRIEYKTAHEAEAVDVERKKKVNPAPLPDEEDDARDRRSHERLVKEGEAPTEYIRRFRDSVEQHKKEILQNGHLIYEDQPLPDILPEPTKESHEKLARTELASLKKLELDIRDKLKIEELSATDLDLNTSEELTTQNELLKALDIQNELETQVHENDLELKTLKELTNSHEKLELTSHKIPNELDITNQQSEADLKNSNLELIEEIFPYGNTGLNLIENGQISLENIEKNKRILLAELKNSLPKDDIKKLNCFSMVDVNIDAPDYVNEKIVNIGFDSNEYLAKVDKNRDQEDCKPYYLDGKAGKEFDFDYQPNLEGHPGPSPSVILQALTMSNANDGINLERLETIGDSFLKFAITAYLYCAHPTVHEGKLSHMRSKQVSNLNLYRLGRNKRLGARMIASKFEPHDNWLPPCHRPPSTLHPRLNESYDQVTNSEVPMDSSGCFIPYNLITQHSIPDKSIADCVEALIGAYLLECGPRGALLFMAWLGLRVLPPRPRPLQRRHEDPPRRPQPPPSTPRKYELTDSETESSDDEEEISHEEQELPPEADWSWPGRPIGSLRPHRDENGEWVQTIFGELKAPPSPLLRYIEDPEGELEQMLSGYDALERTLQYRFKDRSLLLQALTHASHQQNRLTDCYQRLEFLGDAILDYLITRHLYEDPRRHSPGALTDLRSALVNNTIFATLAARHGFHKYFRHMSPGLNEVLTRYVKIQEENGHSISEEHYLIQEDEMEQAEDVEVPKALGDLFESVAGAIFLDSGMSLGAVWKSYVNLMGAELEAFSAAAPKSPVRELLEAEPDTAKFGKPERLVDGRRVRVCVEVFGRGAFKGVGRNYRIAKGTAARCALRHLKIHRQR